AVLVVTDCVAWTRGAVSGVQPNGQFVLAGGGGVKSGKSYGASELARYNPNGSLDTSFGRQGEVTTFFGQFQVSTQALLLQANGELIVAGDTDISAPQEWLLARYNANGGLDTSFGNKAPVHIVSASGGTGTAG